MTTPASDTDPFVRACLIRLLHGVAADKDALSAFTGALWLTYREGKRLRPKPLSDGGIPPGLIPGDTFPEMLANIALVLSTRHGQVLCRSVLNPGFSGAVSIGYAMNFIPSARHVAKPRPTLIGIIVQLDGTELVLTLDTTLGIVAPPDDENGITALITNTWAVAETIFNMSHAPAPADAAALAKQIIDVEPALELAPGLRVRMSGSDVEGSPASQAARRFLENATAAAASDCGPKTGNTGSVLPPEPPERKPSARYQISTADGLAEAVGLFTNPDKPPPLRVVARTYRTVD